jgi:adenylate cyclase
MKKILHSLNGAKSVTQTLFASAMRRFESRALILVGVFSTSCAIFSFAIDYFDTSGGTTRSDTILKLRLSGPEPAADILIVDIDERSLAVMSGTHGNWPWSRDVLANGLQHLADLGVRGVLFNVMMSDPDLRHPDSDAAMEITAALFEPGSFPLIRLNPKNDGISKLDARSLPGATFKRSVTGPTTVAAVIPFFKPMHTRLGVSNQFPDRDGIVRRYPYVWVEDSFTLPSIVKMTFTASGLAVAAPPDIMTLNWRNKRGRYQRISFVDIARVGVSTEEALRFKNAIVVLGVSAPGIGQVKPTAVTAMEDDNEILATAIDDAKNGTYFRTVPAWVSLLISIASVWGLIWLAIVRLPPEKINRAFVLVQLGLAAGMLFLASYTYFLIDLSLSMSFVLLTFAAIKLIRIMSDYSARARPGYRKASIDAMARTLILAGFRRKSVGVRTAIQWEHKIQRAVGMQHLIRIDDLFGGDSFLVNLFSDYEALIILANSKKIDELIEVFEEKEFPHVKFSITNLEEDTDIESEKFRAIVAGLLMRNAADVCVKL